MIDFLDNVLLLLHVVPTSGLLILSSVSILPCDAKVQVHSPALLLVRSPMKAHSGLGCTPTQRRLASFPGFNRSS